MGKLFTQQATRVDRCAGMTRGNRGRQGSAGGFRLRYTFTVHSEILFIVVLIAPWALVLVAALFYRQRRKRKALNDSGGGRDGGDGGV